MRSAKELVAGAAETPIRDHVARFWHLLATETVRLHLDLRRDRGDGIVYWDGASFSDEVAKAIAADYIERTDERLAECIRSNKIISDKLTETLAAFADIDRTAAPAHVLNEDDAADLQQGLPYQGVLAAKRTDAPADLVLETTAEERSAVLAAEKSISLRPGDIPGTVIRLLRDHDTLTTALAAANERAASETKRADDAVFALKVERDVTATLELMRDNAQARADREAAARRKSDEVGAMKAEQYVTERKAREQAEAERAALRAALVLARNRLQRAAVDHPTGTEPFYRVSEWADEASDVLASETKWADEARSELARLASMKEAGDIAVEEEANKRIKSALAERDREADARREAEERLAQIVPPGSVWVAKETHDELERAYEQAEAEVATLRAAQSQAAVDVLAERRRQIEAEGWSPEHDDAHDKGEMAAAAVCYAFTAVRSPYYIGHIWPWSSDWWKPKDPRRDLVKAGALILAEIERRDRAALATNSTVEGS